MTFGKMAEQISDSDHQPTAWKQHPFRRAVLRGLAVVLPPLLTIVLLFWVWNTVQVYVLNRVETGARIAITWCIADIKDGRPEGAIDAPEPSEQVSRPVVQHDSTYYVRVSNGQWIPLSVYQWVAANPGPEMPESAKSIYHRFVDLRYLRRFLVIPLFLSVFILFLYLLGRFLAAGMGRFLWTSVEQLIHRVPVIRNVYGSVKQVTDLVFSDQEIEYSRVVAVEYPRKGVWSLGFVTGEGMLDIRSAANESVLCVFVPNSPLPATGFTVTARRSEMIDLNITVDQAIQFIVSCGVVVPETQQRRAIAAEISTAVAGRLAIPTNRGPVDGNPDGARGAADASSRAADPSSNGSSVPASDATREGHKSGTD